MKAQNITSAIGITIFPFVYIQVIGYENINQYILLGSVIIGWFIGSIIGRFIGEE